MTVTGKAAELQDSQAGDQGWGSGKAAVIVTP
jgi:hypothetical protein